MVRLILAACGAFFVVPSSAFASSVQYSLDYNSLDIGFSAGVEVAGGGTLLDVAFRIDGATITHLGNGELFVYGGGDYDMPELGGFCPIGPNFSCKGDTWIEFDKTVNHVSFSNYFFEDGDGTVIRLFSGEQMVGEQALRESGSIVLSSSMGITAINLIDDSGDEQFGVAFGDFRYSEFVAVVPGPLSLPLLASGVIALAGVGRLHKGRTRGKAT